MRFYFYNGKLVPGPNLAGQGEGATASRSASITASTRSLVEVQWLKDDGTGLQVPYRHDVAAAVSWGLKVTKRFEDPFVLRVLAFDRPADDSGFYTAWLYANTDEAKAALKTPNGNPDDDLESVALAGEIQVLQPAQSVPDKTAPVYVTLLNCYTQGTEGVPTTANPSITLRVGNYFYLPAVSAYAGGTSGCLDTVATATLPVPQLAQFIIAGQGLRSYQLVAGTDAEDLTDFTVIRPDDYNASTNAKVWKSVA